MLLLIGYVLLALVFSFLCSIMEAVLLSITPSYVAAMEHEGRAAAKPLRRLKDNVDRPLAAILSLNTIAHTVGAAGAGAQAALVFGDVYVGAISAVLTLLILVFSEIIPKTIGATYWRALAPALPKFLIPTIWLMWPLVELSKGITRLISRGTKQDVISRAELSALADIGMEQGVIQQEESQLLKNILKFNELEVRSIMTPRTVTFILDQNATVDDVVGTYDEFHVSRIPIYDTSTDDVTGYVLKDDLLLRAAQDEGDIPLHTLKRKMLMVSPTTPLPRLFERLLETGEHIALVVGPHGGFDGVVSMEDVIETLLGFEIVDEADTVADLQELARQRWLERARRLGLVSATTSDEPDGAIRFGITGNLTSPHGPHEPPEPSTE